MNKPVLVIGAGGHASVIIEILVQINCKILGIVSKDEPNECGVFNNLHWFKDDNDVLAFNKEEIVLVNAIGSLPGNNLRVKIYNKFKKKGYKFMTVISPSSIVSKYAKLSPGVQVLSGAIVNTNATVLDNSIINSGAIIEHDCIIGKHNHIAPGAKLSGSIVTGDFVHIGTGASLAQCISVSKNSVIGCGVSIVKDVEPDTLVVPAKNSVKLRVYK